MSDPQHPPPPFDDFGFHYDPSRSFLIPEPPPLPPSAGLFSPSETTDLFGFLDNFNFDLDHLDGSQHPPPQSYHHQDQEPSSFHPSVTLQSVLVQSMQSQTHSQRTSLEPPPHKPPASASTPSAASERHGSTSSSSPGPTESAQSNNSSKNKTLLTTPQKRLNHIMSEQKRRNAIRDGYIQLTTLLAPAGAPPGAGMPTRGRPKGSGARGGRGGGTSGFKGKSGILFRAVEYIHWLEEGRDALREEVAKLEAAAGIQHPINA